MEKMKRTFVQVQCSNEQRERWKTKAEQSGDSLSDLLRRAFDEMKPKRRQRIHVDPDLIRELARIGNNLNQLGEVPSKLRKWQNFLEAP